MSSSASQNQTYEEVMKIITSLPSVKGVRLSVKSTFFGVEWAASQDQTHFIGELSAWKVAKKVLMIRWAGWDRNRQCPLETLDVDNDGESVEVRLLPYADGRPPPVENGDQEMPEEESSESEDEGPQQPEVTINLKNPMQPLGIDSHKVGGLLVLLNEHLRAKASSQNGNALLVEWRGLTGSPAGPPAYPPHSY